MLEVNEETINVRVVLENGQVYIEEFDRVAGDDPLPDAKRWVNELRNQYAVAEVDAIISTQKSITL